MTKASDDFVCVLRASSRAPGLGELLKDYPRWRPDVAWKAGATVHGRKRTRDGFNLFIADGGDWEKVMAATRRRLRALTPMIEQGRKLGAAFQLDFGVMPGGSHSWNRSALFATRDLVLVADLGVELCVTAYPVSEPALARAPRRAGVREGRIAERRLARHGRRPAPRVT